MPTEYLTYDDSVSIRSEFSKYASENMNISPNAELVFRNVYLRNLEDGKPETVADRMAAVSLDIASAEMKYLPKNMPYEEKLEVVKDQGRKNLELYVSNKFRANTPTNLNMGRWGAIYDESGEVTEYKQSSQLGSACFVIPVEDTFGNDISNLKDGILEAWVVQQLVHKGGGGTGFSFQELRPKGSIIGYNPSIDGMNSISWEGERGVSSGYESFNNYFFNQSTEAVKQGNSRRGANMGIQRIDHMDFLDHMYAKFGERDGRSEWRMKNFNLSFAVTDEFMDAALEGRTYTLYNPHRAKPAIKKVLQKKWGVENPEMVRKQDLATREQFESILEKNSKNVFAPLTTPNMYIDNDDITVINAYNGEPIGRIVDDNVRIDAKKVFDIFATNSHSNGEPALYLIDRANEYNPILNSEEKSATNPCGEQPLPPYGACTLGSLNTGGFVEHRLFDSKQGISLDKKILDDEYTLIEEKEDGKVGVTWLDWDNLRGAIRHGTRFLDNVIDRSDFPAQKIRDAVEKGRNIGLGYMGVHDAMILLKMRYGSEKSYEFAERLGKELHDESLVESRKLAKERGEFPLWEESSHNPDSDLFKWYNSMPKTIPDKFKGERKLSDRVNRERVISYGNEEKVRNECRMTHAPTGTIRRTVGSSFFGLENLAISSGVEPVFTFIEESNIINTNIKDISFSAAKLLQRENLPVDEILKAMSRNKGSVHIYSHTEKDVEETLRKIPEDIREVLVSASGGEKDIYEIKPEEHVKMQAVFQKYNDSSISKTVNLPMSATPEDVRDIYTDLWLKGAKGGTAYVDRSREFQILNTVSEIEKKEETNGKVTRPLLQRSITLELPYASSIKKDDVRDLDYDPERCFTTLTFNPVNKNLTGVFQNIPETDPERVSLLTSANIELSRTLKNGRSLDNVIGDLEKINMGGAITGIVVDEAVMNESSEKLRYQVEGSTTRGDLLNSLYVARFLTDGGKNLDSEFINERLEVYESGEITLRSIINTKGEIKIEDDKKGRPSILGAKRVINAPEWISEKLCPECG